MSHAFYHHNCRRQPLIMAARGIQVDLIFFDAGGGHRASATALQSMLERTRRADGTSGW